MTTSRVALVGYSGEIATSLARAGFLVHAFDLDPAVCSLSAAGLVAPIAHGDDLFEADVSLIVATGMTMVTNTFTDLADYSHASGIPLIMYCQTGANLGAALIDCGASTVIAEKLPFYNWEGESPILIYRR